MPEVEKKNLESFLHARRKKVKSQIQMIKTPERMTT